MSMQASAAGRTVCNNVVTESIFHSYILVNVHTGTLLCPRPHRGGGGIRRSSSSVCLSVRLMSRTSALTRKPKGLWRQNFAQGHPRSHATPTPTSRSKGQKSSCGGGIMWRRPSRTACYEYVPQFLAAKIFSETAFNKLCAIMCLSRPCTRWSLCSLTVISCKI